MSDIINFQNQQEPLLVGPFQTYRVQIDGRFIPRLTGFAVGSDRTALIVDGRFSAEFSNADAWQAAWLIAQALAVAEQLQVPALSPGG